ncbi:MAG TPA: YbaY family lipoprotein [Rubrivivax sp.]
MKLPFGPGTLARCSAVLLLVACSAHTPQGATVAPAAATLSISGRVSFSADDTLPPDAVLTVKVEDVSRADAPATTLVQSVEPLGTRRAPVAFRLEVPVAAIDPRLQYAVRATITVAGALRFTTTRHHPVLTRGAPNEVELALDAVGHRRLPAAAASGTAPPRAALRNTYWKLVELGGTAHAMLPGQQREVRITLSSSGLRLFGFSGCNALDGRYEVDADALFFVLPRPAPTRCTSALDQLEARVLGALRDTQRYRIEGEGLTLLGGDQILARFHSVYLR